MIKPSHGGLGNSPRIRRLGNLGLSELKATLGARSVLSISDSILVDGQVNAWPFSVFTQKQVFGPYTVKSQPIWIKFCMHLLLYGINLWANSDCDRLVGGSRPNQNAFL